MQPALPDGPVQGLLADSQQARGRARADELVIPVACGEAAPQPFGVLREEAAMTSRGDQRRPELSPRDRAENTRTADAKTVCQIVRTEQSVKVVCWSNALLARRDRILIPLCLEFPEWRS